MADILTPQGVNYSRTRLRLERLGEKREIPTGWRGRVIGKEKLKE